MKLYRKKGGSIIEVGGKYFDVNGPSFDELVCRDDLHDYLNKRLVDRLVTEISELGTIDAPVDSQEVWAAGVTYLRSRSARIDESKDAGGGDFYDRVYTAPRPELFFKSAGHRVVGPGGKVRVRSDSKWTVPEPELTLMISASGKITGYTIGNDMSSRDIEGENPLYLPQAKIYDGRCCVRTLRSGGGKSASTRTKRKFTSPSSRGGAVDASRLDRNLPHPGQRKVRKSNRIPVSADEFPKRLLSDDRHRRRPARTISRFQKGDEIAITIEPIETLLNAVE